MDMEVDVFGATTYGKVALQKFAPVSATFRIYRAGWLGDRNQKWEVMEVAGADFHVAQDGREKGKLAIKIKGSERTTHVTRAEMRAFEEQTGQLEPDAPGQNPPKANA